ncbi:MAG TPA: TlpA disulfide reductase family protein [Gemmataceae bacterium]|nr:TlpA disulfide reductase family protein [Gemmataceae bacterium]
MRRLIAVALAAAILTVTARAEEKAKQAPKVVLKSPDGKKSYDLQKLAADGPVLVRLTCACTGCDAELPYFQKLQAAYNAKGLKTVAVFREKPEALEQYVVKKDVKFMWLADPDGALWNTFDTKAMPTNILIDKGGKVVKVVPGCTTDGKNAQILSGEVAKLLKTETVQIAKAKK